uniref:Ornithine decarboxylase antizyme n=1 Tax=Romanomermis culicivorax TaxID=13658 RepID=A0A915JSV7_ROMCU
MIVDVNSIALCDWSKENFVQLLEYAEEVLNCKNFYVKFDKCSPSRSSMIRIFTYLGFTLMAPDRTPRLPNNLSSFNNLIMVYNI